MNSPVVRAVCCLGVKGQQDARKRWWPKLRLLLACPVDTLAPTDKFDNFIHVDLLFCYFYRNFCVLFLGATPTWLPDWVV